MALTARQQRFVDGYVCTASVAKAFANADMPVRHWRKGSVVGYYVYALTDPRNDEIFYIGKGKGNRCLHHFAEYQSGKVENVKKYRRIREIVISGSEPIPVIIESSLKEDAAYVLERLIIDAIGLNHLTNAVPGQFTERERTAAEAQSMLDRVIPFERWVVMYRPDQRSIEMYHFVKDELTKVSQRGYESSAVLTRTCLVVPC